MESVKKPNILTILGLFILSAGMLTVIQAPFGWGLLAWFCMVPFLYSCMSSARSWTLIWTSFLVSACYWLGNLYWLAYMGWRIIPGYILLCLYLALYWPVLILLFRFCRRKVPWVPFYLLTALLLTGAEAWQGILITGFSWRLLAHSQYIALPVIQSCDIFGELGITFLIAMVNGLCIEYILFKKIKNSSESEKYSFLFKAVIVMSLLIANIFYGRWRLDQDRECIKPGPMIGSVQPNLPSNIKEESENAEQILLDLTDQSSQCFNAGASLVAWPETIVLASLNPNFINNCIKDSPPVKFDKLIREHARDKGYVLAGAHGADVVFDERGVPVITDKYNAAYLYRPDGQQDPKVYNKIHLVPFGEYIPFKETFPPIYNLILHLSPYDYDYNLTRGSEYTRFEMIDNDESYNFGCLICYEDTDAEVTRRMVVDNEGNKTNDWLVNISNDGWYVGYKDGKVIPSTELAQRTVITAFRAIENRISIIRSVNTGISCLVNSEGKINDGYMNGTLPRKWQQRQGVEGWFIDNIPLDNRVTFFSRHGLWLKHAMAGLFAFLLVCVLAEAVYIKITDKTKGKSADEN